MEERAACIARIREFYKGAHVLPSIIRPCQLDDIDGSADMSYDFEVFVVDVADGDEFQMKRRIKLVDARPHIKGDSCRARHRYAKANRAAAEGILFFGAP